MSWPVGTIVVCVEGSSGTPVHAPIAEGSYYTIRDIVPPSFSTLGVTGVRLAEIRNPSPPGFTESNYRADRFRSAESAHSEAGTVRAQEPVSA